MFEVGKVYGNFKILSIICPRQEGDILANVRYLCQTVCCGDIVSRRHQAVRTSLNKVCGSCVGIRREKRLREEHEEKTGEYLGLTENDGYINFAIVLNRYKQNARKRNKTFELSSKQFLELTRKNCFYCGDPPNNLEYTRYTSRHPKANKPKCQKSFVYSGIDRVDSSKGYILDNCVPCCNRCNMSKLHHPQKTFLEMVYKVYHNLNLSEMFHA